MQQVIYNPPPTGANDEAAMSKTQQNQPGNGVAYSYVRFSSGRQADGDSLRRQTERAEQYCQQNGLTLSAESYRDLGISGFRGRNVTEGRLGAFLAAVRSGRVAPGSTLVVEHLDRLSRNQINVALPLFINIVNAGINVATLIDGRLYTPESISNANDLMYTLMLFAQAAEESKKKSDRVCQSWAARRRAAEAGHAILRHLPKWLRIVAPKTRDQHYELAAEYADIVRQMFQWAGAGVGCPSIAKRLNTAGVAPFGRSKAWNNTSVQMVLKNRNCIGEYQPTTTKYRDNGQRYYVPVGNPIKNHFPPVVTEDQFYAAQRGMSGRLRKKGRLGRDAVNLWSGLLYSESGNAVTQAHRLNGTRILWDGAFAAGRSVDKAVFSIRANQFDAMVFFRLASAADFNDSEAERAARQHLNSLEAQLEEMLVSIDAFQNQIIAGEIKGDLATQTLAKWQQKRDALRQQIEGAKRDAAPRPQPLPLTLPKELARLVDGLSAGTLSQDERLALREYVRSRVAKVIVNESTRTGFHYRHRLTIELLDGRKLPLAYRLDGTRLPGQHKISWRQRVDGVTDADIVAGLAAVAEQVATAARKRPATPLAAP